MEGQYSKPCDNCPYCKDHVKNQFYKIAEFEDGGMEIWHCGERNASGKSPHGDVFILRITRKPCTESINMAPQDLDIRQINCPRCRYKLTHVKKLMQTVPVSFQKGLSGVCDHCTVKQTPQDPCYSCAKTLKEFLTFEKEKWKKGQPPYYDRDQPLLSNQVKGLEVTEMFKQSSALRGWHSEDSINNTGKRSDLFIRDHTKESITRDKMFGSAETLTGAGEMEKRVDADQRYKVRDDISGKRLQYDEDETWEQEKYKDDRGRRDIDQLKYKPSASSDDIDPRRGTKVRQQIEGAYDMDAIKDRQQKTSAYDIDRTTDIKAKQQRPEESKVERREQFDEVTREKPEKTAMATRDKKAEKVDRTEVQKGGIVEKSATDKAKEKVSRGGYGQDYEKSKKTDQSEGKKTSPVDKTSKDKSRDKSIESGRGKDDKTEKKAEGATAKDKSKEKASKVSPTKEKGEKTKSTEEEKSGKSDKKVKSGEGKGDESKKTSEYSESDKKGKVGKTAKDTKTRDSSPKDKAEKRADGDVRGDEKEGKGDKKAKDSTPKEKTGKKVTADGDVRGDEKEGKGETKSKESTPKDKAGKKVTTDDDAKGDEKGGKGEKKAKDTTSRDKTGKKGTTDTDVKDDEKEVKREKRVRDDASKDKAGTKGTTDSDVKDEGKGEKKAKDSTPKDKTGKKGTTDGDVKDDEKEVKREKRVRDDASKDKTGTKGPADSDRDDEKEGKGEKKAKDSTPRDKTGKKGTTDSDVKDGEKEGKGEKKAKDSTPRDKAGKKGTADTDVKDDEKEVKREKRVRDDASKDKTGTKGIADSDAKDDLKEGKGKKTKPGEMEKPEGSTKKGDGKSDKNKDTDTSGKTAKNKGGGTLSKDDEKFLGVEPQEVEKRPKDATPRDESGKKLKTPANAKDGEKEEKGKKSGKDDGQEKDDEKGKKDKKRKDSKDDGKSKKDQGDKKGKKVDIIEPEKDKGKSETTKEEEKISVPANKVKILQSTPDLITKLVQQRDRDRDKRPVIMPEIEVLPKLPKKRKIVHTAETETDKESELELDRDDAAYVSEETKEIIVGTQIYDRSEVHIKHEPPVVMTDFEEDYFPSVPLQVPMSETDDKDTGDPGVMRYALSDRTFIENGYTVLPTIKTFRKINLYRMRPANPEQNWFERNKGKGIITYCTGEKLAEIDEKGRGCLYYKNGRVALEYHDAEESNAQQRFIIRSSGEPDELGRTHPISVLGIFDHLGGGIVFDHAGKIRLKYNQSEGVVLDRKIGPLSHWQWHCLNDPPVLQQVVVDSKLLHLDPKITQLGKGDSHCSRERDDESMLAIEYENLVKENKKIRFKSYEPFQIRMKVVKINQQFSLRILDQSSIYIKFRDGNVNLKFNIGMKLDHQEIVDTDFADLGVTPVMGLDKIPAHSASVQQLQMDLDSRRNAERMLMEREVRVRNPVPVSQLSVDLHTAALSRPLRLPFTEFTDECNCRRRRIPCQNNIYYSTSGIG